MIKPCFLQYLLLPLMFFVLASPGLQAQKQEPKPISEFNNSIELLGYLPEFFDGHSLSYSEGRKIEARNFIGMGLGYKRRIVGPHFGMFSIHQGAFLTERVQSEGFIYRLVAFFDLTYQYRFWQHRRISAFATVGPGLRLGYEDQSSYYGWEVFALADLGAVVGGRAEYVFLRRMVASFTLNYRYYFIRKDTGNPVYDFDKGSSRQMGSAGLGLGVAF